MLLKVLSTLAEVTRQLIIKNSRELINFHPSRVPTPYLLITTKLYQNNFLLINMKISQNALKIICSKLFSVKQLAAFILSGNKVSSKIKGNGIDETKAIFYYYPALPAAFVVPQ